MMGKVLITLQTVFCILLIYLGWSHLLDRPIFWPLTILGIAISASGVWAMKKVTRRIKTTPEPFEGTPLCKIGIYRLIRHPMHSGLLLSFAMFASACENTFTGWGIWIGLVVVLIGKIRIEEKMLGEAIPAYQEYRQTTKRLIPFIF